MQQIGYDEMEALGKALSHTKRVELLRLVAVRGALSAGELTGLLGLSGGAVTGHIRALEQARLVRVEKSLCPSAGMCRTVRSRPAGWRCAAA